MIKTTLLVKCASFHNNLKRTLLEGTPRRVQYTFNNTDITEYQPPPCYIDWPDGALEGKNRFSISHCPNIVSELFLYI